MKRLLTLFIAAMLLLGIGGALAGEEEIPYTPWRGDQSGVISGILGDIISEGGQNTNPNHGIFTSGLIPWQTNGSFIGDGARLPKHFRAQVPYLTMLETLHAMYIDNEAGDAWGNFLDAEIIPAFAGIKGQLILYWDEELQNFSVLRDEEGNPIYVGPDAITIEDLDQTILDRLAELGVDLVDGASVVLGPAEENTADPLLSPYIPGQEPHDSTRLYMYLNAMIAQAVQGSRWDGVPPFELAPNRPLGSCVVAGVDPLTGEAQYRGFSQREAELLYEMLANNIFVISGFQQGKTGIEDLVRALQLDRFSF